MNLFYVVIYIFAFLYGICIGSFSNVCILRVPVKESIVPGSHCMTCGHKLAWYDLVPLFSWLFLGGKCRYCHKKISKQYPLVEGANGLLYALIFIINGVSFESGVFCLMTTALIAVAVVDWRTFEIPDSFNLFIFILGVILTVIDVVCAAFGRTGRFGSRELIPASTLVRGTATVKSVLLDHLLGMGIVGGFLLLLFLITVGRAMGGGDVKLMLAAGLVLGVERTVTGFLIGCIGGSIIHLIRMASMPKGKKDHHLAFGPYLAGGLILSIFIGRMIAGWYLGMLGLHPAL